ncbi:ATP-binding protein [Hymenobacter sp. HDW8]|uniref:HD domain-containing protein n=1 Tax=Hymenobacter sp. HDW8 TaxID=2714932 RepID=UPI00140BBC4D|nr:ATP-binding protein [Hymenobacter sp. HDW8]QIL77640.1 hypothetical protein G7064_18695 [Hymenobacter sp. HDW8]
MSNFKLPKLLKDLLDTNEYNFSIQEAIKEFTSWLEDSKMPFFVDYTDHGIKHLQEVLATTCALIPKKSKDYFSSSDAGTLILSVLFHDCAMHLSKAGFKELIYGNYSKNIIAEFDKKTWTEEWEDFLFFARRWDDNKLSSIFGTDENGIARFSVQDPFEHFNDLNESDHRLIGEFIRKHHARLAHEIAIFGVPGYEGVALRVNEKLPLERRDLAGVIARSHNLHVRDCLDYLQYKFGSTREYQGIHAVYLMTLLRVADYLQIQSSRASEIAFKYKEIPSRISQIEFKTHHSVKNITATHDDPESLQIHALPSEVELFLRLKEWLNGIQSELDASWAVLGEVYGKQKGLRKLGLSFRRIRSNIDDVKQFSDTVSYVPDLIRFDIARAELLKLLIGPLYSDDPSYGVRELMQNSIDAVREYDQFILDHPECISKPRRLQEKDVEIELSPLINNQAYMTISDKGIGMKEEVIRDYFLRAGASYRQSDRWKSAFEHSSSSEKNTNKSKVLRSGRFGVGALAAFLIGDEIEVETRHVTDEKGYYFKTQLETNTIEVIKKDNINVGTLIKVKVDVNNYKELTNNSYRKARPGLWDWYCLEYPTIARKRFSITKEHTTYTSKFKFNEDLIKNDWKKLNSNHPYEVFWSFQNAPRLICNGLFVSDSDTLREIPLSHFEGNLHQFFYPLYPKIFIKDVDGLFPLNLQRNDLRTNDYPFGKELVTDLITEMIAWFFYNGPDNLDYFSEKDWRGKWLENLIVMRKSSYGIKIPSLMCNINIKHIIYLLKIDTLIKTEDDECIIFRGKFNTDHVRIKNTNNDYKPHIRQLQYRLNSKDKKQLKTYTHEDYQTENKIKYFVEWQKNNWLMASTKNCPPSWLYYTTIRQ